MNLEEKMNELVKGADTIVASSKTIVDMQKNGLSIENTFTNYEDYIEKLLNEKKTIAKQLIHKLPRLDENVANSTIQALYKEVQECFVLGMSGACITLSSILLELALKYRLYHEKCKGDKSSLWEQIEKLDFTRTVNQLRKMSIISLAEKKELDSFNASVRNPYVHYNIQKLVGEAIFSQLKSIDIKTKKVTIHKNVKVGEKPFLWFFAKKFLDNETLASKVSFCIGWTNRILRYDN